MNISDENRTTETGNTTQPHEFFVEDSVHHQHWRHVPQLHQSVHVVFAVFGATLFTLSFAGNVAVIFLFRR